MNPAYKTTVFQALPEDLPASFHILTAWNPNGETDWPGTNQKRDVVLAERLDALSLPRSRVTGMAPDERNAEPGWAFSCNLDQALELGREFLQEAIYQVEEGALFLVNCETGKRTRLGPFAERLRNPRENLLFTIHLGSPAPRARLLPTEELGIRMRTAQFFDSFTIIRAEGLSRSQSEDTHLISAATRDPAKVVKLALELMQFTAQEGVGISHNGIYQRVTEWSDWEFLLRVWGFTSPAP